jgi:hypothetical protein
MFIYKSYGCFLEYDEYFNTVVQNWNGPVSSQEFRKVLTETEIFFKSNNVSNLISNTFNGDAVDSEDVEWAATDVLDGLISYGLERMIFILPRKIESQISVDHFISIAKAEWDLPIKSFLRLGSALNWIGIQSYNESQK